MQGGWGWGWGCAIQNIIERKYLRKYPRKCPTYYIPERKVSPYVSFRCLCWSDILIPARLYEADKSNNKPTHTGLADRHELNGVAKLARGKDSVSQSTISCARQKYFVM